MLLLTHEFTHACRRAECIPFSHPANLPPPLMQEINLSLQHVHDTI